MQGLYPFSSADRETLPIDRIYNKALYHLSLDELKDRSGNNIPLINPKLNTAAMERQWFGKDDAQENPGVIVIDDILSADALAALQQIMFESTVWYQTKLLLKFGGYVGAYIDDGFHDCLLLQLAKELQERSPRILKKHPLRYLWAYKYDSNYTGINLHANQATVNVNIWLLLHLLVFHPLLLGEKV